LFEFQRIIKIRCVCFNGSFFWAFCFAGGAAQAALDTNQIGLQKVPKKGAIETNASYFYNTLKFKQV